MSYRSGETILLTGATGTVGRELLRRMLVAGNRVLCLIRAADDAAANQRLNNICGEIDIPSALSRNAEAVAGDLSLERMGIPRKRWLKLALEVERIVHGAATVSWNLPLNAIRKINTEGTRRIIELASAAEKNGALKKLDYISTCAVAGRRQGLVREEELDDRFGFFNSYEKSKFEAEKVIRGHLGMLPVTIYRLSTVVGDSRSGQTSSFNVLYWPLKVFARGLVWIIPADPKAILDIVPVDFACDAIEALSADPGQRGKCFHIAAGPGLSSSIDELIDMAAHCFGRRRPILVPPGLFFATIRPITLVVLWGKRRAALRKGSVYVPYLSYKALFDTTQACAALEPKGLRPPPVRAYFKTIMDYATSTDWGERKPLPSRAKAERTGRQS